MYGTGKQGIKGREDNTKMSETYEIIVLDLDGTLTNSKKVITPKTKEALMRIQKEGKKVVLASGRPTGGIVKLADELDLKSYGGFVLAFNGGKIINYGTGEIVYNKTIPVELVPAVYEQACRLGVGVLTYKGNTIIHGNGVNEYSRNEGKINGMPMKEVDNFAEYVDYPVPTPNASCSTLPTRKRYVKCLASARSMPRRLFAMVNGLVAMWMSTNLTRLRIFPNRPNSISSSANPILSN